MSSSRAWFGLGCLCLAPAVVAVACSSFSQADAPEAEAGAPDTAPADAPTTGDAGPDASTRTCTAEGVCEIATGEVNADEIVADEDHVLWTTAKIGTGLVRHVALGGGGVSSGPAETLAGPDDLPHSLHLYGPRFYYATGVAVRFGTTADGADGGTRPAIPSNTAPVVAALRTSDTMFVLRGDTLAYCATLADFGCGARPLEEHSVTMPKVLASASATADEVWYIAANGISKAAKPTFNPTMNWNVVGARSLAVDASRVYFTTNATNEVRSKSVTASNASASAVVALASQAPGALAVDSQHVYFTVPDANVVMRASKTTTDGGAAEVVFDNVVAPRGIALNAKFVFVTLSDGRVLSRPKPQ
ncbi:MAG: hypothetical protein KF764_10475 [Labilithrix sp.]|nr:hypothetical protein [Labilithrix sp.]